MLELIVERDGPIAVLTMNRPEKRNALSVALRDAISDALDAIARDEQMKCVVIASEGPVFSASRVHWERVEIPGTAPVGAHE